MRDHTLWKKINHFNLDENQAAFSFSKRLARDNNWSVTYACKVIDEYKKFMYLCCVSEQQITPSDAVDQAWHLHLTYTQSYWKDFCQNTLGKEIHHNPTKGGDAEKKKFSKCYDATFELYTQEFGEAPIASIWLNNKTRFTDIHFQRINTRKYWLIKKPKAQVLNAIKVTALVIAIPVLFIRAENGGISLGTIMFLLFGIVAVIKHFTGGKNGGGDSGCTFGCSSGDSGCSSGCSGCGGCGD